jgi:hypothetical protein
MAKISSLLRMHELFEQNNFQSHTSLLFLNIEHNQEAISGGLKKKNQCKLTHILKHYMAS